MEELFGESTRSSTSHLLHQIRQQGGISIMHTLMNCIQQAELEHRLVAANLLIQLDMQVGMNTRKMFRDDAMQILLETVASEENSSAQALSAHILSNLGGTYSWEGKSYTAAWLAKNTGLTSVNHKNMFKNIDWLDPCLQVARCVIKFGESVFNSLGKGIRSKTRSVPHECLIAIAWLGSEMAVTGQRELRYSACEILLSEVVAFLHPGSELEERLLACLCVYNYTSGKGKQKLLNFSECLRESLRRLSGVTWMAEELLQVTEYFLTTQPRDLTAPFVDDGLIEIVGFRYMPGRACFSLPLKGMGLVMHRGCYCGNILHGFGLLLFQVSSAHFNAFIVAIAVERNISRWKLQWDDGLLAVIYSIAQFCWKEGSHESGQSNICETINSYIADQRAGFAETSPGVELYCPPHPKTTEILQTHLPQEHTETLKSNKNDGLIGVVVWRRPHVTTISLRMSSHHKRKHSSSKKRHQTITNSKSHPDDEPVNDIPPRFGPGCRVECDHLLRVYIFEVL